MPTFSTPQPISVHLELAGVGVIRLLASDRSDTAVVVRPTDPMSTADEAAAASAQVEYSDGQLTVNGPKGWRFYSGWGGWRESIDVEIAMPAGSRFEGKAGMGTLRCEGPLDEVRFTTGAGEIHAEETGAVTVRTGFGNVSIERAGGQAEIATGSGRLQVHRVDGPAAVRNSNGDTWIGDVGGELQVRAANGKIAVDRPQSGAFAKTANGDIVIGAVASGEVVAATACGQVEIGVANGVPRGWSFTRIAGAFAMSSTLSAHQSRVSQSSRFVLGQVTVTSRFTGHSKQRPHRTADVTARRTAPPAALRTRFISDPPERRCGMVSTTSGTLVNERTRLQGHVEGGWGKVADTFRANFEGNPGEVGAACCVYAGGRPVVDLWGGLADREAKRPWAEDAIAIVASTTKGATAICAHLLAQRGELDLDAPVVKYWPEFGRGAKEQIPVRWLLSHQAGLPVVDSPLTFEQACAWHPVIRALEAQKPLWQPGTEHVYHSVTFGFLVGEVVRRITGKSLGTFFADEVVAPLGLSAWIGLPNEEEGRVARIEYAAPFTMEEMTAGMIETTGLDRDTVIAWMNAVWGPGSVQARAAELGGAFTGGDYFTTRAYRAAEFPFGNMFTDARSLARMYAATVSDVDGVRLLNPATVERMTVVQTDKTRMHGLPLGLTIPADRSFYMSLGFWRACPPMPWAGPRSFGHPGSGGSVGFADPEAGVGFGYVTNLWSFRIGEPRASNLAAAVVSCLG